MRDHTVCSRGEGLDKEVRLSGSAYIYIYIYICVYRQTCKKTKAFISGWGNDERCRMMPVEC